MSVDHFARLKKGAENKESVFGISVARSWACFAIILGSYQQRDLSSHGIGAETAEKIMTLFLLYRPDLAGAPYDRVYIQRGPVTDASRLRLKASGSGMLSAHLQYHCDHIHPSFLELRDGKFYSKVTATILERWRNEGVTDHGIERDAEGFGRFLRPFKFSEMRDLAIALNLKIVTDGLETDLGRGWEALRTIKIRADMEPSDLIQHIQNAAQWFGPGKNKAQTYEEEMPKIKSRIDAWLESAKKIDFLTQELPSGFFNMMEVGTVDDKFRRLKWACRILRQTCAFGQHVLSASPAFPTKDQAVCPDANACAFCKDLLQEIKGAANDGVLLQASQPFSDMLTTIHNRWSSVGTPRDGDLYSYWQDFSGFAYVAKNSIEI